MTVVQGQLTRVSNQQRNRANCVLSPRIIEISPRQHFVARSMLVAYWSGNIDLDRIESA